MKDATRFVREALKGQTTLLNTVFVWFVLIAVLSAAAVGTISNTEGGASVRAKLNTLIGRVNELSVTDGLLGFSTQGAIEVSAGVATISTTVNAITAQTTPGADDVDTITLSGAATGDIAIFYTEDASDAITFKHNTGNIDCGADILLDSVNETVAFRYEGGATAKWRPIFNSANIETVDDTETWIIAASDESTALTTTGNPKATFRAPYAFTITGVRASVTTAPTGANLIVDINEGGTTIMTTNKLSIDATEKTSTTAATAAGVTDTAIADDAEITIDIDQIGSSVAGAGLKVYIEHTRD